MDLKEFIKESLVQINLAIEESNKKLEKLKSSAIINPSGIRINSENSQAYGREDSGENYKNKKVVHKIDFDVAVYAKDDTTTNGGAKISIASIGIDIGAQEKTSNKSESRLKFSIPVIYPEHN